MNLVKRAEWQARAPRRRYTASLYQHSTGHWNGPQVTVGGKTRWEHPTCYSLVRGVQNFHMDSRGWNDIAYNFVVCPHGYVFEGRGLNTINAANGTNLANKTSHAIMWLVGEGHPFTDGGKRGFRDCVRYVADATEAPDSAVGHRDHRPTSCPGDERYNWIRQGMPVPGVVPQPEPSLPVLRLESRGDAVRRVQTIIRDKAGGDIAVDGIFGPHTEKRVKDVQRLFGLDPDGIVESKTWSVLLFLESVKPSQFGDWPHLEKPTVREGARGAGIKYLQSVIYHKAGGNIDVDGIFGPATEERVKDVQSFFGLQPDGIVGPKTWAIIDFLAVS